ncbi:MAG: LPS assembly lipoprotein LptE [Bacteroidales bacterium]|nr:LPS assembly lipoprotein LptE [Bacteroidales bacterium]
MRYISLMSFIFIAIFSSACKVKFTFTGASISPELLTFSVTNFQNNASLVNPILAQILTEKLRNKISSQTRLKLVNSGGDIHFEGEIVSYSLQPVAIQSNETAQLTQLTITIFVRCYNKKDETQNYETRFSRFQQFPSNQNFSSIENDLIDAITDELVDDIYRKTFVNW